MHRIIPLSLIAVTSIYAAEVTLSPINVESTLITEVAQNAKVSADLAQALSTAVPSIDMNRRSGIANDIYIRGQKRDNISIEVDGTKICGACPNRMDPPVSHILASQIDEVEVIEGPYDVETFGTMSGGVKIKTKKPSQKFSGEMNFGAGSWRYRKMGVTGSGGNDLVRVLVSASSESSDQYEDGDGNTLAEQVKNNPSAGTYIYAPQYEDMKAYTKKSAMTKVYISTADNQELQLSYTGNRSDSVLYPNSKMDAIYDDSNIYSIAYNIDDISNAYKNLNIQYYYSDVDHPMGTDYRVAGAVNYMTSQLQTTMQGLKLKNSIAVDNYELLVGLDGSKRTWDGIYYKNGIEIPDSSTKSNKSIDNAITDNMAIFAKVENSFGNFDISLGARYDITHIQNDDVNQQSNDYNGFNANIFTVYNLNREHKLFFGLGQASRVPDARELYFKQNAPLPAPSGRIKITGTDDLDMTTNQEVDFGYETDNENFKLKIKGFYSLLTNYIYYNKDLANNNFVNIDATVYGAELSASIYATDDITVDMGASYKRGQKDQALDNQDDKDLADMAPLRGNIALNYEYANNSLATLELIASDKWSDYDADNGEQELAAWSIVNLKAKHAFSKNMDFTVGINNLFNETYTQSNTYVDLILLSAGTDTMLINEPGRYLYTSLDFKF